MLHPEGWPRPHGYSNGLIAGGAIVSIAGQVGWDPKTERFLHDDIPGQLEQALRNILVILAEAGGRAEHVARLTFYVTDVEAYRSLAGEIGVAYRSAMGSHYPPMTLVQVAALMPAGAHLEIEALAVVPAP